MGRSWSKIKKNELKSVSVPVDRSTLVPIDRRLASVTKSLTAAPSPKIEDLFPDKESKYGLRILHKPTSHDVDIVFIHGLTGRADKTFLHDATHTYWPVHLLPHELPNARILAFGYDADVTNFMGAVGKNTIEDHASNLVNDLARVKRQGVSTSEKTIFVAHSLGGLVVKKAMTLSETAAQEHLRQIQRDTAAITFFGTPHRGSNLAPFAKVIANAWKASGKRVNTDILEVLKRDSQVLAGVERDFVNWVARQNEQFQISCFFETQELPGVGMIVKAESAKFGHWPQQAIRANHMRERMDEKRYFSSTGLMRSDLVFQLVSYMTSASLKTKPSQTQQYEF